MSILVDRCSAAAAAAVHVRAGSSQNSTSHQFQCTDWTEQEVYVNVLNRMLFFSKLEKIARGGFHYKKKKGKKQNKLQYE